MKIASVISDERVHKEEDLAVMTIHDKPEWCSVSDYESLMHAQCRRPLWPPLSCQENNILPIMWSVLLYFSTYHWYFSYSQFNNHVFRPFKNSNLF